MLNHDSALVTWCLHLLKIYEGLRPSIVVQLRDLTILSQGISELPGKALQTSMKKKQDTDLIPSTSIFEPVGHTIM